MIVASPTKKVGTASGIAGADYGETIEIDPAYLDVTVKRWQDFTGETVTLGARFDEMILKAVA